MTKTDVTTALIKYFQDKLTKQEKVKFEAEKASDEAPGRNEARYDTSKDDFARMAETINKQIQETQKRLVLLESKDFASKLICLSDGKDDKWYFLSDLPGGEKVLVTDQEIVTLNPSSPLGKLLVGCVVNQTVSFAEKDLKIIEVTTS